MAFGQTNAGDVFPAFFVKETTLMSFDPFKQKVKPVEEGFESWKELFVKPYDKNSADPYTKLRIILMNGGRSRSYAAWNSNSKRNLPR